MTTFLGAAGVWTFVIGILGIAAISAAILLIARRDSRYAGLVAGLTAVTFFVSVVAYGIGMWQATLVMEVAPPLEAAAKMGLAHGYASVALALGGMLATVSALLGALGWHRALPAVRS